MVPARHCIPAVLQGIIQPQPLTPAKVEFAWRMAVGPAIARTTDVALEGGILTVRLQSRQWRTEIERASALILDRVHQLLGSDTVTRLAFVSPPGERRRRPPRRPPSRS